MQIAVPPLRQRDWLLEAAGVRRTVEIVEVLIRIGLRRHFDKRDDHAKSDYPEKNDTNRALHLDLQNPLRSETSVVCRSEG